MTIVKAKKMPSKVEFENASVRVTRVTLDPGDTHAPDPRSDRIVVFLSDHDTTRIESGSTPESIQRLAGEFVWRDASKHTIENQGNDPHETLVIELKPRP